MVSSIPVAMTGAQKEIMSAVTGYSSPTGNVMSTYGLTVNLIELPQRSSKNVGGNEKKTKLHGDGN